MAQFFECDGCGITSNGSPDPIAGVTLPTRWARITVSGVPRPAVSGAIGHHARFELCLSCATQFARNLPDQWARPAQKDRILG